MSCFKWVQFYGCNHSEWEARNKDVLENLQLRKWNRYSLRAPSATSLPATIGNVKNLPCPPLRLLQAEVLRVFRRLGLFLVLPQQSCSPAWTRAVCTGLSMAWASVPGWAIFCSADSSRPEAESSRRRWRSQVAQVLASSPILPRPLLFHLYAFTFLLGNRDRGCLPLGSTSPLSCSLGPMTRYDILSDSGGGLLKTASRCREAGVGLFLLFQGHWYRGRVGTRRQRRGVVFKERWQMVKVTFLRCVCCFYAGDCVLRCPGALIFF